MTSKSKLQRAMCAHAKPRGYALFRDFLNEVEDGVIPQTATVMTLAAALEKVLLTGADPMQALQLKRGRGEKPHRTGKQDADRYGQIWDFIAAKLDETDPTDSLKVPRGKKKEAIEQAAAEFKKDQRSIERAWRRYEYIYLFSRENRWALAIVEGHLTAPEWNELKHMPFRIPFWIAMARRRQQPLGATFREEVTAAVARYDRWSQKAATK